MRHAQSKRKPLPLHASGFHVGPHQVQRGASDRSGLAPGHFFEPPLQLLHSFAQFLHFGPQSTDLGDSGFSDAGLPSGSPESVAHLRLHLSQPLRQIRHPARPKRLDCALQVGESTLHLHRLRPSFWTRLLAAFELALAGRSVETAQCAFATLDLLAQFGRLGFMALGGLTFEFVPEFFQSRFERVAPLDVRRALLTSKLRPPSFVPHLAGLDHQIHRSLVPSGGLQSSRLLFESRGFGARLGGRRFLR